MQQKYTNNLLLFGLVYYSYYKSQNGLLMFWKAFCTLIKLDFCSFSIIVSEYLLNGAQVGFACRELTNILPLSFFKALNLLFKHLCLNILKYAIFQMLSNELLLLSNHDLQQVYSSTLFEHHFAQNNLRMTIDKNFSVDGNLTHWLNAFVNYNIFC